MRTDICISVYICRYTYDEIHFGPLDIFIDIQIHTYTSFGICFFMCIYIHTYIHAYMHIYIYTYIYMYRHILPSRELRCKLQEVGTLHRCLVSGFSRGICHSVSRFQVLGVNGT